MNKLDEFKNVRNRISTLAATNRARLRKILEEKLEKRLEDCNTDNERVHFIVDCATELAEHELYELHISDRFVDAGLWEILCSHCGFDMALMAAGKDQGDEMGEECVVMSW